MLFLGFTDDVLEWPWSYKLVLPTIASLPLLCCYNGSTNIVVPIPLRSWIVTVGGVDDTDPTITWFGTLVTTVLGIGIDPLAQGTLINVGILYYVYMGMLAVFCTNAINIYAGINGLEVGQSYVIGCAVLVHNLLEISLLEDDIKLQENHLFSVMLMTSFVGVTIGLLQHNWYPAQVFVGDTYCYFAGMTFAVVGILGHFSKTLLLFFLPQVVNFLYSTPQLFKLVPCPRHRLPGVLVVSGNDDGTDSETTTSHTPNLRVPSTFPVKAGDYVWMKRLLWMDATSTELPNMTLINLTLRVVGPVTEETLCTILLGLQIASCAFGLFLRCCRFVLFHHLLFV